MKRHAVNRPLGNDVVFTALEEACPDCGRTLPVYQSDGRRVQGLDAMFWMKRRDKRCCEDCPGQRPLFRAPRDLRVVLPGRIYGMDVTLHVGERHLVDHVALAQITRDLNARGLPIDQRHTGRVFRDFMALASLARDDDAALRRRLRKQGGIVLMCDGVQFENRSPVLYLVWDALSGEPLFGERKQFHGEADLVPLLQRVRALRVPIIGVVTDKERGLVPAVQQVFPDVPYQFCQTHFLRNCAKPLLEDAMSVASSVRRRSDAVHKISKRLSDETIKPARTKTTPKPAASDSATPVEEEVELAATVGELVRVNSRVCGKAPLDPPELKRHERLERIRSLVVDAGQKKGSRGRREQAAGRSSTS